MYVVVLGVHYPCAHYVYSRLFINVDTVSRRQFINVCIMFLGDSLSVSTVYSGDFELSRLSSVSHLVLVAAGTGFTPMAGLIQYMLETCPQQQCRY